MIKTFARVGVLLSLAIAGEIDAREPLVSSLTVIEAWTRPTVAGMSMGVAYFKIVNRGKSPDTLVSVSSPAAESAELHRSTLEGGMARMRPAGDVVIAPGATVKAEPEGLHVMLHGLKQQSVPGSQVPLTLTFKTAGAVTVQLEVRQTAP